MEVNHRKEPEVDQPRKESEIHFTDNQVHFKCELENEAHPFEDSKMEATVKVETYGESDSGDPWTSIVKSELVEFRHNNDNEAANPSQENHLPTNNLLNNILKIETETETKTQISFSHQNYPLYNNAAFSGSDSDADPERDPFADIDCDQNFSQAPPSHNRNDSYSATQVQLINAAGVVSGSSNPSSSSGKSFLPNSVTPKVTEDQIFDRQKSYYFTLQCHLCLVTQSSESKLKIHLEICAASHKNRNRFCILCNKLFSFPQGYRRHAHQLHGIKSIKSRKYTLKCNLCPCVFVRKKSLLSHVAIYHRDSATERDESCVK